MLVLIHVYVTALTQYEATKAYMPKEPDELSLQQAEVVIVMQEVDGKDSLHNSKYLKSFALGSLNLIIFTRSTQCS